MGSSAAKTWLVFLIILISKVKEGNGLYKWSISIVKHVNIDGVWRFVDVDDVICSPKDCSQMYARIRALHRVDVSTYNLENMKYTSL